MLEELDGSLREFLRNDVPLRAGEIDIDFAAPDKDWSSRLSRSTVNLFLFDIRRSTTRATAGTAVRERNGTLLRGQLAPMMRVRYLLSVWTAEAADEHRVLGDVLRLLAVTAEVPTAYLRGELVDLGNPVELGIAADDGSRTGDLWGPLGVAPRASLELVATLPARVPVERGVPAPPTEVDVTVVDRAGTGRGSRRRASLVEDAASARARGLGGQR